METNDCRVLEVGLGDSITSNSSTGEGTVPNRDYSGFDTRTNDRSLVRGSRGSLDGDNTDNSRLRPNLDLNHPRHSG